MATTTTPLYGFSKFADGDTGWGSSADSNEDTTENEIARARIPFLSPTVGATTTIDCSQTTGARFFAFVLSQATTIAFSNVPTSAWAVRIRLLITNGGAFVISWPASVTWLGGVAPALKASGVDEIELRTKDGGVTWYAELQADRRFQLGASTAAAYPITTPDVDTATTSSGAGSPANLKSYTVPANTLDVNGLGLKIRAWGTTANNANAKAFRIAFGATLVANFTLTISTAGAWYVEAMVYRTGAATQKAIQTYAQHAATTPTAPLLTTPAETLSGAVVVQCSCTQTSAADVVQEGLTVEHAA